MWAEYIDGQFTGVTDNSMCTMELWVGPGKYYPSCVWVKLAQDYDAMAAYGASLALSQSS